MSIKKVKFNQLYRLRGRDADLMVRDADSYCVVRFVGRRDLTEDVVYSIERADLWRPKQIAIMRISQNRFESNWLKSLTEVKSKKEKILVALKTGLLE